MTYHQLSGYGKKTNFSIKYNNFERILCTRNSRNGRDKDRYDDNKVFQEHCKKLNSHDEGN